MKSILIKDTTKEEREEIILGFFEEETNISLF